MSIRRFELERYLAGELEGEERRALEERLKRDPDGEAALDALRREQAEFEAAVPYAHFRVEHERRKEARRPRRFNFTAALGSLATVTAAAALLWTVSPTAELAGTDPLENTRLKGDGVALTHYVQGDDGTASAGVPGERLAPGAVVQLAYEAGDYRYGALLGVDGEGRVSQYWPRDRRTMAELPQATGAYPFALTLDATPGRERFYALFSNRRLDLHPLRAALEQTGAGEPDWPEDVAVASTWVEKGVEE